MVSSWRFVKDTKMNQKLEVKTVVEKAVGISSGMDGAGTARVKRSGLGCGAVAAS